MDRKLGFTMPRTRDVRNIFEQISGFHLVVNRDAVRKLLRERFLGGLGGSELFWGLVAKKRFVQTYRVLLINKATKHLKEAGWQEYSADPNPFVTVGTLLEGVDPEVAGGDLLWRWMNPPPPVSVPNTRAEKRRRVADKIFCNLLENPVLLPSVIRPILESDS